MRGGVLRQAHPLINRLTWHCSLCLSSGNPFAPLVFAGLHTREIGGPPLRRVALSRRSRALAPEPCW